MNTLENQDLRVQKTLECIKTVFEEMLLEMDYEKITVTTLCTRAKINRKTFYRYYPTIDDLLHALQLEFSKDYIERIKDYELPREYAKTIRTFIEFSIAQGPLYEKITCHMSYETIRNKMISHVMNQTWSKANMNHTLNPYQQNILTTFLTVSGLELYKQWVADGKQLPVEDLISTATDLICNGLNGFLNL